MEAYLIKILIDLQEFDTLYTLFEGTVWSFDRVVEFFGEILEKAIQSNEVLILEDERPNKARKICIPPHLAIKTIFIVEPTELCTYDEDLD